MSQPTRQKLDMSQADIECLSQSRKHIKRALDSLRSVAPLSQHDGQEAIDVIGEGMARSIQLLDNLVTRGRLSE